jgi:hypothetical protein
MTTEEYNEMEKHFDKRTKMHIGLVQDYANDIADAYPEFEELRDIVKDHDASKFVAPEYEPYLYISWKYKMERDGKPFNVPEHISDRMLIATERHVLVNKHHPEYWCGETENLINSEDRDKPRTEIIFAQDMPNIYIAEMVADWFAVSAERNTHPKDWADKNVGVRWDFTKEQSDLIYDLIKSVW